MWVFLLMTLKIHIQITKFSRLEYIIFFKKLDIQLKKNNNRKTEPQHQQISKVKYHAIQLMR